MNEDYTVTNRMQLGEHQKKVVDITKETVLSGRT